MSNPDSVDSADPELPLGDLSSSGTSNASPAADPKAKLKSTLTSALVSKNVIVNGRRTSMRLEPQTWNAIDDICCRELTNRDCIFGSIAGRLLEHQSLSSAVRIFVITYFQASSTEAGHFQAGHGPTRSGYVEPLCGQSFNASPRAPFHTEHSELTLKGDSEIITMRYKT